MTIVAGYIDRKNKKGYVASDTLASTWDSKFKVPTKIFRFSNKLLIGYSTSFMMENFLRVTERNITDKEVDMYRFRDSWQEYAQQHNYGVINERGISQIPGSILVISDRKIFTLQEDGSIIQIAQNMHAIGCGYEYALGAMIATEGMIDSSSLVRAGVSAAMKLHPHCGGRIKQLETL